MSISCNAVQDLIVLFQENAVSEETKQEVKEHLKKCGTCRKFYKEYAHLNQDELHFSPEFAPEEELGYSALAARIRKRRNCRNGVIIGAFAVAIGITVLVTKAILRDRCKHQ